MPQIPFFQNVCGEHYEQLNLFQLIWSHILFTLHFDERAPQELYISGQPQNYKSDLRFYRLGGLK